jgi:copper chaperone CopZ
MKKSIFITIAILLSLGASAQDKKKIVDVSFKTSITCDNCVNTIMSSLPLEKGIKDVKCDLETKEVRVSFRNDRTDKEKIKRSLEKLGYVAEEVKEKDKAKKTDKDL